MEPDPNLTDDTYAGGGAELHRPYVYEKPPKRGINLKESIR